MGYGYPPKYCICMRLCPSACLSFMTTLQGQHIVVYKESLSQLITLTALKS